MRRYGIAPDRLDMIGFSAGAITTMAMAMAMATAENAADRPYLAVPIYGTMLDKVAPAGGPPLFVAATQDDNAVPAGESVNIYTFWSAATLPAELHLCESGRHGFGMMKKGNPVDAWTGALEAWLGRMDG